MGLTRQSSFQQRLIDSRRSRTIIGDEEARRDKDTQQQQHERLPLTGRLCTTPQPYLIHTVFDEQRETARHTAFYHVPLSHSLRPSLVTDGRNGSVDFFPPAMESDDSKESDQSNPTARSHTHSTQLHSAGQHPLYHNNSNLFSINSNSINNSNNGGAMKKTNLHLKSNTHRRRWILLAVATILLLGVVVLRSNETAQLGFVDSPDYKLIHSKADEQSPPSSNTPPNAGRSSWFWSRGGSSRTNQPDVATTVGAGGVTNPGSQVAGAKPSRYAIPLHAAEALQCRDSVVNFVINATDGKDECAGLQKAFDKTCGTVGGGDTDRRLGRRRAKWAQHQSWRSYVRKLRVWSYRAWRWTCMSASWWISYLETGDTDNQDPFFFAEDEIVEAWQQAEYLVANGLDRDAYADVLQRWRKETARATTHRRRLIDADTIVLMENETDTSSANRTKTTGPLHPLDMPTAQKHASEHLVEETLRIHQEGEGIQNNQSIIIGQTGQTEPPLQDRHQVKKTPTPLVLHDPQEARRCCASILNVYHENCSSDDEEQISDSRLFFVVCVMAACGMTKSLIRHFKVLWLPEAAGCILVGVASGYIVMFFPHHDLSFDGHWFLRIMVPPIIFEAALSIDKRSFNRHLIPILFYAFGGTLMATFLTAYIVHKGSHLLQNVCTPLPYVESLTFGALISSIDPIAVLSVLNNMGMTDMDTIYVVIFGESLLNDGVAIVLFETLVRFLDDSIIIDSEEIAAAAIHFSVVAVGSLLVGVGAGMLSTIYFWIFHGVQTPLVEVLMFFCFALLPYYICDGIEWSGIVCTVATGFAMDLHIVGQRSEESTDADSSETEALVDRTPKSPRSFASRRDRRPIFNCTNGQLSEESRAHIGFVAEIIATTMETAIFAYLGLFLFSHRYHWNFWHTLIAIAACGLSRAMMIPTMSFFANWVTKIQGSLANGCRRTPPNKETPSQPGVMVDKKMQMVLWFAGLRGAMSFALVEHIPMYDSSSGEGTPLKPELKAMTSASILFTVFVLGGYTFYVMEHLGMSPSNARKMAGQTSEFLPVSKTDRLAGSETASTSRPSSFDDDDNDATISMRARRRQGTRTSRSPMRVELSSR